MLPSSVARVEQWSTNTYQYILFFGIETCLPSINHTSRTAQRSGGSSKNRKPIGEIGCCESWTFPSLFTHQLFFLLVFSSLICFLLTFSSLIFFSSSLLSLSLLTLFSDSFHLCLSSVHVVGSLTSKTSFDNTQLIVPQPFWSYALAKKPRDSP